MSEQRFVKVLKSSELTAGKAKVVKIADKQIALFRLADERVCAIDNRCPHEGYPLAQGTITVNGDECLLTCDWHNWKFALNNGQCLRGGEDVRSYPVQIEADEIRLDISDPPTTDACQQYLSSLRQAMAENDDERAARDIVRLLKLNYSEIEIITEIARFGATHDGQGNDYHGWDHGMATMVDCVRQLHLYQGAERAIPLSEGLSAVIYPRQRQGLYQYPDATPLTGTVAEAGAEFRRLVEAENSDAAIAVLRGALAAGADANEIKQWIFTIVTDHFLSYGHRLIYAVKAFQLLALIGWQYADEVLPGLVAAIVWATREDRLPYMRKFQTRLQQIDSELPDLLAIQNRTTDQSKPTPEFDEITFRAALLDGTVDESFDQTLNALRQGVPMQQIIQAIILAASERLLRFNIDCDRDRKINHGWLDVTHCFTHASAVREALELCATPQIFPALLRAIFQAARFVQYTRQPERVVLDLPIERREAISAIDNRSEWSDLVVVEDDELLDRLIESIETQQHIEAMRLARGYLELERPATKLTARLLKYALADSADVPIALAHTIKTTVAAVVEFEQMPNEPQNWLTILAAVRFLAAPKRQRWTYAGVLQAIDFVANSQAKE